MLSKTIKASLGQTTEKKETVETVETEGQKFCLLLVPRAAAAFGWQLKIEKYAFWVTLKPLLGSMRQGKAELHYLIRPRKADRAT